MPRIVLVGCALLLGCTPEQDGWSEVVELEGCSAAPLASSIVRLQSDIGEPTAAESVTYAVDGWPRGLCTPIDNDQTVHVCGWSEVGWFTVSVARGDQVVEHSFEVATAQDCQLTRRVLEVVLDGESERMNQE